MLGAGEEPESGTSAVSISRWPAELDMGSRLHL